MTKSPLTVTLIPLIPLAALGWPLAKVINQKVYVAPEPEEVVAGPITTADLEISSAHPFTEINVTIGEASWKFGPDDEIKEIHYERGTSLTVSVSVIWPDGTPKSAVLLELMPEGNDTRSHTLWGWENVTEEITFTWDDES